MSVKRKLGYEKHGMTKTPIYKVWQAMINRCHNPLSECYHLYGGRGIKVCKRWRESFLAFLDDMGQRPSKPNHELDRINSNKGYFPANCRWANRHQQTQNSAKSYYWHINGRVFASMSEAAIVHGVSRSTIRGWCKGDNMKQRENCHAEKKYP